MNVPGRPDGNWRWRTTEDMLSAPAFQRLRAFSAKETGHGMRVSARGEEMLEIRTRAEKNQRAVGLGGELLQSRCLVKSALFGAVPCARRPAFKDRQIADCV